MPTLSGREISEGNFNDLLRLLKTIDATTVTRMAQDDELSKPELTQLLDFDGDGKFTQEDLKKPNPLTQDPDRFFNVHGMLYLYATEEFKRPFAQAWCQVSFWKDRDAVIRALKGDGSKYHCVDANLQKDPSLALLSLKDAPYWDLKNRWEKIDPELRSDQEFRTDALKLQPALAKLLHNPEIDSHPLNHSEIILKDLAPKDDPTIYHLLISAKAGGWINGTGLWPMLGAQADIGLGTPTVGAFGLGGLVHRISTDHQPNLLYGGQLSYLYFFPASEFGETFAGLNGFYALQLSLAMTAFETPDQTSLSIGPNLGFLAGVSPLISLGVGASCFLMTKNDPGCGLTFRLSPPSVTQVGKLP